MEAVELLDVVEEDESFTKRLPIWMYNKHGFDTLMPKPNTIKAHRIPEFEHLGHTSCPSLTEGEALRLCGGHYGRRYL